MICTVVREGYKLFVRFESIADSTPERVVGYWPVSEDRSIGAWQLEGCIVEDRAYQGVFSIKPGVEGQDFWRLKQFKAVLVHNGRTEAERIERTPIPAPKVKRGIEIRWYEGRWQKLLKRGWVDA